MRSKSGPPTPPTDRAGSESFGMPMPQAPPRALRVELGVRQPSRGLAAWRVKRVTGYVRERLDQEISLGDLAALVGLSRFHFCTAFRLATGQTPYEWLTAQRIERGRELLQNSALPVTDIALAVGYATPSAFSASFRRLVGTTPTEYRRRTSP